MTTTQEIIANGVVRTSIAVERIIESISSVLKLDNAQVNTLRDIAITIAKQEMTTFMQEANSIEISEMGTGYQPVNNLDKDIKPPPKFPNGDIENDKVTTNWGEFYSSLREINIVSDSIEHPLSNEVNVKKHKCSSASRLDVLESRVKELED